MIVEGKGQFAAVSFTSSFTSTKSAMKPTSPKLGLAHDRG